MSKDRILVDPSKIEVVKNCLRPTSATEVRTFLVLVSYYRRFVEGFSKIATPWSELTKKKIRFEWNDHCEKSFQELKKRLITGPMLSLPVDNAKFVVYSDTSKLGLGFCTYARGQGYSLCIKIVEGVPVEGVRAAVSHPRFGAGSCSVRT